MKVPALSLRTFDPQKLVYKDAFQKIYRISKKIDGSKREYFVRDTGQRAGVVVLNGAAILLIRQYRFLINGLSWEIPGGRIDENETPEDAAVRECREEAGILCRGLRPLISFYPGMDILYNPTYLFHTNVWEIISESCLPNREIHVHAWVPYARCFQMIREGQILDSFSIIALLSYALLKRSP